MPRKKKTLVVTPAIDLPQEFLEELIPGPMDAAGVEAVFQQLKKAVIERALGLHLADPEGGSGNHRNGRSGKTVLTDESSLRIDVPRDRTGTFEPQLIPKHERRFAGFDERIVSMYAGGMTVREIQSHLAQRYSLEVSPEFISKVTDEVMSEGTAWQARPPEAMYPVVFFDALRVKIREVGDILIGVADGLKGFPEALEAVFPATTLQTCIVHLTRNSLDYASWKDRKALAAAIKPIYTAPMVEAAEAALDAFEASDWGKRFPTVVAAWRRAWTRVVPFFAFPPDVRRVIYTTNAIESVHARLRKIIKTRGHFPSDEAAAKLVWLALRHITADWSRATRDWKAAMNQFAVIYQDRFTLAR